jgi:uncharacterized protein (DUF488 family)
MPCFFTIGHSTRSFSEFLALLRAAAITRVIDVRAIPHSAANPQFGRDALAASLAAAGIGYEHSPALGGLRGRTRQIPPEVNAFWKNQSFHNFADYATTAPFREALLRVREIGRSDRCAIMCAEALWWRCHRRIIADYLLAAGARVHHLMHRDSIVPARLTQAAVRAADGTLHYPAHPPKT